MDRRQTLIIVFAVLGSAFIWLSGYWIGRAAGWEACLVAEKAAIEKAIEKPMQLYKKLRPGAG